MNDFIYKSMADAIKNKLIKNLINDEEFKNLDHEGLNLKDLIETKVSEKLNKDIAIIDTAGRLHIDEDMMDEC